MFSTNSVGDPQPSIKRKACRLVSHSPELSQWQAPFRPAGKGDYFFWPLLTDLMPWQHSGVQLKRTWPIAPDVATLERRWRALVRAADRAEAFRETEDRRVGGTYRVALTTKSDPTPIAGLPDSAPMPEARRYAYRSFDRHYVIADGRLMSRPRPDLWHAHGTRQVYLTSLLNAPLGEGPALTASACIPDLHHFSGRGAKDTIPLYRDAEASNANILPGLIDLLSREYARPVTPEDFLAYVYGVLAHPAFTARFDRELESRELRAPITRNADLFEAVRETGARLLWLHTYGERCVPVGAARGRVTRGAARCTKAVAADAGGRPDSFRYSGAGRTLHIGGGEFAPVAPEVYEFDVSGLKVVRSWLGHRLRKRGGKRSSPLDDIRPDGWTSRFTTEVLELLWVMEATVKLYPEQAELLDAVMAGDCLRTGDLPPVPADMRKPPKPGPEATLL